MSVRANIAALGELALMPLAALVALASGLVFLPLIVLAFVGFFLGGWFGGFVLPWSIFAASLAVRNSVECLAIISEPDWRRMAMVTIWSCATTGSCPFLWMH